MLDVLSQAMPLVRHLVNIRIAAGDAFIDPGLIHEQARKETAIGYDDIIRAFDVLSKGAEKTLKPVHYLVCACCDQPVPSEFTDPDALIGREYMCPTCDQPWTVSEYDFYTRFRPEPAVQALLKKSHRSA